MRNNSVKKIGWKQVRSTLLCTIAIFLAFCLTVASVLVIKDATMSTRERTKLRLMYMIEHGGWDPYSANMSLEEYFALMELYDDGKLPLKKNVTAYANGDGTENGNTDTSNSGGPANRLYFPREKFLLSGLNLTNYSGETPRPLLYNSDNRYGPHDPNTYAETTVDGNNYTTNTLERYETFSATFVEIDANGNAIEGSGEYEVIDGLLYKKNTDPAEEFVATEENHYFKITELPHGDEDKINWHYRLTNGVLYLIDKNDGSGVEDEERPNIRIYTPKYYEMHNVEYVFQEKELHVHQNETNESESISESKGFSRLYNKEYASKIKPYQFAFRDVDNREKIYVMNADTAEEPAYPGEGFRVYDLTGKRYALKANPTVEDVTSLAGTTLESLNTSNASGTGGNKYIVTNDGGLWEYDETKEDNVGDKPFNEDEGDFYVIDSKQLCEWRRGKLYIPGTNIEWGHGGFAADQFVKELAYYYPEGLDTKNGDYMRPPREWLGLMISGDTQKDPVRRVSIVQEQENTGRIAGNVRQDLFGTPIYDANKKISGFKGDGIQYDKYYIKRVTLDSANVNVLGVIWAEDLGKYVYYYLSAEGQSTQVSTTTLGDNQKFIIEYVPFEYEVSYKVENSSGVDLTLRDPVDVVMFGSTEPTKVGWLDSIFGTNRPTRTVDGAYSFDVLVPYGYEVRIIIKVRRTIEGGPYKDASGKNRDDIVDYTFEAGIDHTSSRKTVLDTWLASYGQYLVDNNIISGTGTILERNNKDVVVDDKINQTNLDKFKENYVQIIEDKEKGTYSFEWKINDANKKIHDGVFRIIAERVNDIRMHNSALNLPETGFPLGKFPNYSVESGSKQLPSPDGPAALTFKDTFYNHLVKADREIIAVLKELNDPKFDARNVLHSNNASGRGAAATSEWSKADEAKLVQYYEIASKNSKDGLPLKSGSAPHNVDPLNGEWSWNSQPFFNNTVAMDPNGDGSYNYDFFFQTNSGDSFYMDVLEINGVAIQIPLAPRYVGENGSNVYRGQKADDRHPWRTTGTLPDGATVIVEFWYGWRSGTREQHHYCIRIRGARTNVTLSGLNLMQYDSGASEFSVYNLVGVYSDLNGETQQSEAVEYFGREDQGVSGPDAWHRATKSTMWVDVLFKNDDIGGDKRYGYANFRFKVADGYGTPYFIWDTLRHGIGFASVPFERNGVADTTKPKDAISFSELEGKGQKVNEITFEPNQIYYDDRATLNGEKNPDYGYYYFRIDKSVDKNVYCGDKMALLTVVARTVKYTVRYVPYVKEVNEDAALGDGYKWTQKEDVILYDYPVSGYVIDRESGELLPMTADLLKNLGKEEEPKKFSLTGSSMPLTIHDWLTCALADMLKEDVGFNEDGSVKRDFPRDENGDILESVYKYLDILHEYDDYGGVFYDLILNSVATVASTDTGIVRPQDHEGQFTFSSWVVVNADYKPVKDEHGNYITFSSGAIDLRLYSNYAVKHSAFGTDDMDLHVLRLMPVWKANRDTTNYRVVLNWVDALGELHAEDYNDLWDDIVTEQPEGDLLYVFLNQEATALQNWIALHPTYTFWDAVNNATTEGAIAKALKDYLDGVYEDPDNDDDYQNILNALTQRPFYIKDAEGNKTMQDPHGGFKRLGADIFALNFKGHITISIWMYENKGGFVFRKEVAEEPFIADDEFYFTVINAHSGKKTTKIVDGKETVEYADILTGVYKAYPQFVYNTDGTVREPRDSDAWLVTFDNGGKISQLQTFTANNKWEVLEETITNDKGEQETVNVTYFTLKHNEGIRLYVPNGQYTVVELGSKSGGSYQAHVEYKASDGSPAPGSWEIQEDEVWLKGDTRVTQSGASQVHVTVDFEIGAHNVVQILTFYNQTTSLSLEKTLDTMPENKAENKPEKQILEMYKELTYTLHVTLQLPAERTPIAKYKTVTKDDGTVEDLPHEPKNVEYYYFTANHYTGKFETVGEGESQTQVEIVLSGEPIKFTEVKGDSNNKWEAEVEIKHGERIVIIMTADYDNINYWVEELDNEIPEEGQTFRKIIEGFVYAKRVEVKDAEGKPVKDPQGDQVYTYQYTYYKTLDEAQDAAKAENIAYEVYDAPIDDTLEAFEDKAYIQPATLAKMDLTPLISPKEGSAQKGKKDIVSVVNWLGELPGYGYLKLTATATDKNGKPITDADGTFIFKITSSAHGTVLYVTLKPGQTAYIFLQAGIYTVEEMGWGWRYDNNGGTVTDPTKKPAESADTPQATAATQKRLTVTISQENDSRKKAIKADYTFTPNYKGWLGGESGMEKNYQAVPDETSGDTPSAD